MAVIFDGTDDSLSVVAAPVTAYPFTMACWFFANNITAAHALVRIDSGAGGNHHWRINLEGSTAGDPVRFGSQVAGVNSDANTTTGFSANTWQHACAVGRSATSRDVYLNGGSKGSNATSSTPAGLTVTRMGISAAGTVDMAGRAADLAIWNTDLSDAEVALLAKGVSPLTMKPQNLVAYWPLVRAPFRDWVGGNHFTANNQATTTGHPPKVGWPPWRIGGARKIAAAVGGTLLIHPGMGGGFSRPLMLGGCNG